MADPHSPDAEAATVGAMLASERNIGEVLATKIEADHFYTPWAKLIFAEVEQAFYSDESTHILSIAERVKVPLAKLTGKSEQEAVDSLKVLARGRRADPREAALLVRRSYDLRSLLDLSAAIRLQVEAGDKEPDDLAASAAHEAMRIATSSMIGTSELLTFDQIGPRVTQRQREAAAARAQGIEVGAYFGLSFMDSFIRGAKPGEVIFIAGEPGAGKSAVVWTAVTRFAERQLRKPKELRVGALVGSFEMGEEPASDRLAQSVAHVDGGKLREGRADDADLQKLVDEWHRRKGLPLVFNYSPGITSHALRALVVEGIRKHNTGLVVIDHLRYVYHVPPAGVRWSTLEQEEDLVRFFKQDIAAQLNVVVIVLAHTIKAISDDGRPRMRDLRGGQMVQAHASHIGFVYRPYLYASDRDIESAEVKRTDAEMIWEKNRFGNPGTADFHFDPSIMEIRDPHPGRD